MHIGSTLQLDHLAVQVFDLKQAEPLYEKLLGTSVSQREEILQEGVRVAFFPMGGAVAPSHLELMEPLDQSSPLHHSLTKRGQGLHHIAFRVDDLELELKRLAALGILPHGDIRSGSRGTRICFVHPRDTAGVLWELLEVKA